MYCWERDSFSFLVFVIREYIISVVVRAGLESVVFNKLLNKSSNNKPGQICLFEEIGKIPVQLKR